MPDRAPTTPRDPAPAAATTAAPAPARPLDDGEALPAGWPGWPGRAAGRRAWATWAGQVTLFLVVALAAWGATRWWLASVESPEALSVHVIVPACVIALVVTLLAGQNRRWRSPRERLRQAIREIRGGRWPIEALREDGVDFGALAALAVDVAGVFRDVRRLEMRLAELEHEADRRMANKTDALQRVIGSLRMQAIRDPLTGLFNRRALDELLPRLIDHCRGAGEDLSVLMIDVDHFKQLNDCLGHAAGDELLRSIAQLIRSSLQRSQDAGFRCGGDEFVVVMPGAPALPARALAERLSSLVSNLARTIKVTPRPALSVGVATLSELPNPTPALLLQQADRRLYDVKQARPAGGRAA